MNASQSIILECQLRTTFGKKNRSLRKAQYIPGVIYGEGKASEHVTLSYKTFMDVYRKAGETTIVECDIDGVKTPTLIADVAFHPVHDTMLHVDFKRINLAKKVEANVPVVIVGESPAVKSGGVLLQQAQEISVECLPQHIPHEISIDATLLTEIGQEYTIADLPKDDSYEVIEEADRVIVSIVAHREESTEAQTERVETEITSAKEPAEGEVAAETPTETTEESKKE